jgi:hypothetical protein
MSDMASDSRCFENTGNLDSAHPETGILAEFPPLSLPNPGRERLQHIIIGSEAGVQGAINYLHLLRYAERLEWSRLFTIPASGLVIRPQPGEVFSYLLRHQPPG